MKKTNKKIVRKFAVALAAVMAMTTAGAIGASADNSALNTVPKVNGGTHPFIIRMSSRNWSAMTVCGSCTVWITRKNDHDQEQRIIQRTEYETLRKRSYRR